MFRLWTQFDLGYNDTIFTSVDEGRKHLEKDPTVIHILEEGPFHNCQSVSDLIADGIMGFRPLKVIGDLTP